MQIFFGPAMTFKDNVQKHWASNQNDLVAHGFSPAVKTRFYGTATTKFNTAAWSRAILLAPSRVLAWLIQGNLLCDL